MPNISQPFASCYDPFLLPKLINFLVVSRSLSAPLAELIIDMAFSVRSIHHRAKPSAHGTQYESACASNSPVVGISINRNQWHRKRAETSAELFVLGGEFVFT